MTDSLDIQAIFADAKTKHDAAAEAKKAMASVMLAAFRNLMPADSVLDLRFSRANPPPSYLARVRTLRGNDRGTKVFRIINVVAVDVDPTYPSLSTWIAEAVPVSEKTGKDMRASTGHYSSQTTVRIHGGAGCEYGPDDPTEAPERQVLDLVVKHCAQQAPEQEEEEAK